MDKLRFWERVGYSIFAAAGIATVIGIGIAFELGKSDWAAWVQAGGSIGAIVGAVILMKHQNDAAVSLAVAMDNRAMGRRIAAVEAIVENCYEISEILQVHTKPINSFYDYFFSTFSPDDLESALDALNAVPVHTLESYKMVRSVHTLNRNLRRLQPYAEIHTSMKDVHYTFESDDARMVDYYCKNVREARDLFRESIIELGHKPTKNIDHGDSRSVGD